MILDRENLFSNKQAITATANSTDMIDLGANNRHIGVGFPLGLLVQAVEDFADATSVTFKLQTDDDESFGSAVDLVEFTVSVADLVAGWKSPVLHAPRGTKRYLRMRYEVTGGP